MHTGGRIKQQTTCGFTIVELLVVIVIIGILVGITLLYMSSNATRTRDEQVSAKVAKIAAVLERYEAQNGRYPSRAELNTANVTTTMTDFTTVKAVLPSLKDEDLIGPAKRSFYPMCTTDTVCTNQTTWQSYRRDQIIYMAQPDNVGSSTSTYDLNAYSTGGIGPGCKIITQNANPGYAIMWFSETDQVWKFKITGGTTIANLSPNPKQICAAS